MPEPTDLQSLSRYSYVSNSPGLHRAQGLEVGDRIVVAGCNTASKGFTRALRRELVSRGYFNPKIGTNAFAPFARRIETQGSRTTTTMYFSDMDVDFPASGRLAMIAHRIICSGALLGSRRAQRESGEMLLKSAVSERQRLIALNLLVRSQEGGVDNLALLEYAESSGYPPAVIAAHTWLRVNLEEIKRAGKASGYFSGWLRNLKRTKTEAMQRESGAAAKILLRDRWACGQQGRGSWDGYWRLINNKS